jgi:hypothetical protein
MCPHCGMATQAAPTLPRADVGDAIVTWLSRMPPPHRSNAIAAEPASNWPPSLIRSYPGRTQADAAQLFTAEATLLAEAGYQPVSQSWAEGRAGLGRTLAFGLYANVIRPNGFLTVTFNRAPQIPLAPPPGSQAALQGRPTKRCPDCAEEVLADARICRFCRHEFWPARTDTGGM